MRKKQLIWFDFTTSLHWTRPAVGIVRAEQECCRWLLTKLSDRVRLCVFDVPTGQFLELEAQEAWNVLDRGWASSASMASPSTPPVSASTDTVPAPPGKARRVERVLRKAAFALLAGIPSAYQPRARSYLVAIRRTLAYGYKEVMGAHSRSATPPASQRDEPPAHAEPFRAARRPLANFKQGDSYLTLGLDWDYGGKMEALYREKKVTGIKVFNFAYDIIPVKFPHYFPSGKFDLFSVYFANMGWTADKIICISECTARDLSAFLDQVGAPQPAMTVIRLGDTLPATGCGETSLDILALLGKPFLLSVSTIEVRKNHESLYRAYLQLIESGFDAPPLVLVGMHGWRVDDFMYALQNDPRIKGKIVVLNHVTDADLAVLYRNCLFTLYPSLYEGWGLPVAESLAYGKFCLASNAASIPEIAGDVIDYVDPWDISDWAKKIRLYCTDSAALIKREQLIATGYQLTSWERAADEVLKAIDSLPSSFPAE